MRRLRTCSFSNKRNILFFLVKMVDPPFQSLSLSLYFFFFGGRYFLYNAKEKTATRGAREMFTIAVTELTHAFIFEHWYGGVTARVRFSTHEG